MFLFFKNGLIRAACWLLLMVVVPAAHAQIVQNGDFSAPVTTDKSGSTTNLPSWKIVSNFVGVNPANNGMNPFADNGAPPKNLTGTSLAVVGFLLSLGNTTPAQVSQTLTGLTAGSSYVLSFYDNASYVGAPQVPTLTVSVGGVQVYSQKLTPVSAYGSASKSYSLVTVPFTATASSEDLLFSSVSPAAATNTVALLTDVTVVAAPKK